MSRLTCLLSLVAFAGLTGCGGGADTGPPRYPVTGKLTNGGSPVSGVIVSFESASGYSATDTTDSEGKFSLQAVEGDHTVVLLLDDSGAAGEEGSDGGEGGYEMDPGAGAEGGLIPDEWTASDTSPKSVSVSSSGENTIDIAIDAP